MFSKLAISTRDTKEKTNTKTLPSGNLANHIFRFSNSSGDNFSNFQTMKKAVSGGFLGLIVGSAVMLFFSWVMGIISFHLSPFRIENLELTPQVARMLCQCVFAGVFAGGVTYFNRRWVLGIFVGIAVGYGLGFLFAGENDQPWATIGALAMLLPVVFSAVLSSLSCIVMSRQKDISA